MKTNDVTIGLNEVIKYGALESAATGKVYTLRCLKVIIVLFILILTTSASACGIGAEIQDNYARIIPFDEAGKILSALCEKDPFLKLEIPAHTAVKNLPLYLVIFNDPGTENEKKIKVMIMAGIHGNEPAGSLALLKWLECLTDMNENDRKFYSENFTFYVIPYLNPEGAVLALEHYIKTNGFWDRTGRENGAGLDCNRDFRELKSNETVFAVSIFNKYRPHVVIDLHEFSSLPLLVDGEGWWRAKFFDVLIGAGRHPDAFPPLADYARDVTESSIFPSLAAQGAKGQFYSLPNGSFDSTGKLGVTGSDYFNLRNALTFLIETAGYDQGKETLKKRIYLQKLVLNTILDRLVKDKSTVLRLIRSSVIFSKKRKKITLRLDKKPIMVNIEGTESDQYSGTTAIVINGRTYNFPVKVQFSQGDLEKKITTELPAFYIVLTTDKSFLRVLSLHGIIFYDKPGYLKNLPAGQYCKAVVVPTSQESSAIAGLIFEQATSDTFGTSHRFIVFK